MPAITVTIRDVDDARARIADVAHTTPLWPSVALSEQTGSEVLLKCENLQRTGSFKVRGAANMLALQSPLPSGVVAASAGNHAQGVALAARGHGLPAIVVMPRGLPLAKQRAVLEYGAEIELVDGGLWPAQERARVIAVERGYLYMPPFDDPAVIAGQGTVALEVLEQCPQVDTVLVPAGGGGLLAGVALALKARRPAARVIGVQARAMPGIIASRAEGRPVRAPVAHTIADGVAVAGPSALTLALIERFVDDVIAVSEEEIARAIVFLVERSRLVTEGAGALGVAALLARRVEARGPTVAVLSGGNIDVTQLGRLMERGLLAAGRLRELTIAAADMPGELAMATAAAAAAGANVIGVEHDLVPADLPIGVVRITLRVEVAGAEGFAALVDRMLADGFVRGTVTELATRTAATYPE
ncbi:MAG: threonine ammonia-lyase [Dehalococcoidia bacterium]